MHTGSLVNKMMEELGQLPNLFLSKKDLEQYEVKIRKPISMKLENGLKLFTLPPPSSGALVGFALNILAGFHIKI